MDELKAILTEHARRYPLMEPTDAVKLIYQNEFGGGHMIANEEACLAYLLREYTNTPRNFDLPLTENIGNGIVRVNLAVLAENRVKDLGKGFIASANAHRGNLNSFLQKLEVLRQATEEGVFSFDLCRLDAYLDAYRAAGYPAVSHSEAYRKAYCPAYRIIKREYFP